MTEIRITPHDPVVARDGRPFGAGQGRRMRSLDWLYPSVVAGSLRTLLGKQLHYTFSSQEIGKLLQIRTAGPFPVHDGEIYLPAPLDIVLSRHHDGRCFAMRPQPYRDGENTNLPSGLQPAMLVDAPDDDFKPDPLPPFWSIEKMGEWLADASGANFSPPPEKPLPGSGFLPFPEQEERMHVKIEYDTGATEEGLLFMTSGLRFSQDVEMSMSVEAPSDSAELEKLQALDALHPLGGERRLAHWQTTGCYPQKCPDSVCNALIGARHIRLVLASPGIFQRGWLPDWIDSQNLSGTPPETGLTLKLVGARIGRWRPVSGWSLEQTTVGAKAIRRMVPAGSTYFFECVDGDPVELADRWLQPICEPDETESNWRDVQDGFGLGIWGIWSAEKQKEGQ